MLFIDELHRLDPACEESLYSALEDGTVSLVVRQGSRSRLLRVRLERFTLVGATTRLGAIAEPFRARFRHRERLEPYSEAELSEVVLKASARLGTPASPEAAREIARRSKGTPREAIRILEVARDLVQVEAAVASSPRDTLEAFEGISVAHVGQDAAISAGAVESPESAVAHLGHDIDRAGAAQHETGEHREREPSASEGSSVLTVEPVRHVETPCEDAPVAHVGQDAAISADVISRRGTSVAHVGQEPVPTPLAGSPRESGGDAAAQVRIAGGGVPAGPARQAANDKECPLPLARKGPCLSASHVVDAAGRLGIDEWGLDPAEQSVVRFLARSGRAVGVEALASRLGLDLESLRDVHEPWLERAGLLERTERGRVATAKARAIYGDAARARCVEPGTSRRRTPSGGIPVLRIPFRC